MKPHQALKAKVRDTPINDVIKACMVCVQEKMTLELHSVKKSTFI